MWATCVLSCEYPQPCVLRCTEVKYSKQNLLFLSRWLRTSLTFNCVSCLDASAPTQSEGGWNRWQTVGMRTMPSSKYLAGPLLFYGKYENKPEMAVDEGSDEVKPQTQLPSTTNKHAFTHTWLESDGNYRWPGICQKCTSKIWHEKKNPRVRSNSQTTTAETDERHISGSCEMKPIFLRVVELNKHLTLLRLQKNHLLRCKLIFFNFKNRFRGVTVTPTTERNVFGGNKPDLSNC